MVQWLRLRASTAGGTGSIPGRGTKTLHGAHGAAKRREKKERNTLHKAIAAIDSDSSNGSGQKSTENLLERIHYSRCH